MLDHGTGHGIHAAKEHHIRLFTFQGGQDGGEVGGFVGGELTCNLGGAGCCSCFGKLVSHTLAVGCAVVNDSEGFGLQVFGCIAAQGTSQMHIVSHHAEGGFVALAGEFGVGGRR